MKVLMPTLCLVVFLSGCIGVNRSSLSEYSYKPYKNSQSLKSQVREEKGRPDEIIQFSGNTEKWIYRNGTHFEGIVLWLVLPIPFVFPSGSHSEEYVFDGEQLSVIAKKSHSSEGIVYGCYPAGVHSVVFIDCGEVPSR